MKLCLRKISMKKDSEAARELDDLINILEEELVRC